MPPIHCVKLRHKRSEYGSDSSRLITVDPVVVNPETDSKKASIGPSAPVNTYGAPPNSDTRIQPKPTTRKPSRGRMRQLRVLVNRTSAEPTTRATPPLARYGSGDSP